VSPSIPDPHRNDGLEDRRDSSGTLLSDFRAGDAEVPAAALDRLIEALGLRLMRQIAR
jgi:hypothetical protein